MGAELIKAVSEAGKKNVKDFPAYKIDKKGNLWSCWTFSGKMDSSRWKKITPYLCSGGYLKVNLWDGHKYAKRYVHRLVLETFLGSPLEGMQACHNNGKRADNRLENLRWDTPSNNNLDKKKHGTWQGGEKNGMSKLKDAEVKSIKYLLMQGKARKSLALFFWGLSWYNRQYC